jgi:cytochrome bd-type quinol oxidase subunit 2
VAGAGPVARAERLIAFALVLAIYAVARLSTPDPTVFATPGYNVPAGLEDYLQVLFRNSLVLALHALACVAGFIAGGSLPLAAEHRSGLSRRIHEKAGPLAIGFVVCATLFSLATQAFVIGGTASSIAAHVGVGPGTLLLALAPHALPELVALFLPLAAWMIASRRGEWRELLAATFVTVAVAVPVLLAAAAIEIWVSPHLLAAVSS